MKGSKVSKVSKASAVRRAPPTTKPTTTAPAAGGALHLVAMGEGVMAQVPLPLAGELTIGRSRGVDAFLDAPSISRRHALLRIAHDGSLTIEDLGSANGTRVRGTLLAPGEPCAIRIGEVIDIGSILITVQRHSNTERPRRIWSHAFFEAHLEEACLRARHAGDAASFAVLDIRGGSEDSLARILRPVDIVGLYAPDEYEVLLVDVSVDQAAELARAVKAELSRTAQVGVACYPRDGRSPDTLIAAARGAGPAVTNPAVAASSTMRDLHRLVERVAPGTISVLILGETGVGKEVLAESVHRASKRARKPFLKLNCAALSESLLETELFGHEKGAFTGAVSTKPGLLETADGGTVFLDEIGELLMPTQVKLLRVIEERAVLRVGGLKTRSIDVRFVAATNRDLEAEIVNGKFRQDLYFRLNGITLVIPPLRERVDEIAGLASAFIRDTWGRLERDGDAPRLSAEAKALLESYAWPGNIRELRNVIERAVLLHTDGPITPNELPAERMRALPGPAATPAPVGAPKAGVPPSYNIKDGIETLERDRILAALAECAGNQTHAARMLGISRATLLSRLDEYNIKRPRKPR